MKIKGKLKKINNIECGVFDCSDEKLYPKFKEHFFATNMIRSLNLPIVINHKYFHLLETKDLTIEEMIKYFTKQLL